MTPQSLTLESFTEGDTWEGIPSITIAINGAAPVSAMSLVTMRFKKAGLATSTAVVLTSATPGQITITNAATWTFTVPEQIVTGLTVGKWTWQIRITNAAGVKKTYLADEIEVLESV